MRELTSLRAFWQLGLPGDSCTYISHDTAWWEANGAIACLQATLQVRDRVPDAAQVLEGSADVKVEDDRVLAQDGPAAASRGDHMTTRDDKMTRKDKRGHHTKQL